MADVITKWQMEWPLYYVIFSSGMLNRTSSHICGRWYLPTSTSVLQGRCHHQKPPDGTKRSRPSAKKKWCHLQIYM